MVIMETKVININNYKIPCFLHYLEIVVRIGSAMVKVGLSGPEEMVSQLPTQGAILDTCYNWPSLAAKWGHLKCYPV